MTCAFASCCRIQSNYLALQRINQELEGKLYRMVRLTLTPLPVQHCLLGHVTQSPWGKWPPGVSWPV